MRREFSDAELVELTGVCGLFALSNRFQDSMRLPIEDPHEVNKIRTSVAANPARLRHYLERLVASWPADYPSHGGTAADAIPLSAAPANTGPARLPAADPAGMSPDARQVFDGAAVLLGGPTSLMRTWAHVPHVGKFVPLLLIALERDGGGGTLPARQKALAMLRTAAVHDADYTAAHATALASAAGVADAKIAAAASINPAGLNALDADERAIVDWAAGVARNRAKDDEAAFAALRHHLNHAQAVELTALCAFTSMTALFANALRLPVEPASTLAALYRSPAVDHRRIKAYLEVVLAHWPAAFPAFR